MYAEQKDMKVPSRLVPKCPKCGKPMAMNLRADDTFVEDEDWHKACERYEKFFGAKQRKRNFVLGIGSRCEHARNHQISVLADDTKFPRRILCLHQQRRSLHSG